MKNHSFISRFKASTSIWLKVFLLVVFLVILNKLYYSLFTDFSWGNETLNLKLKYLSHLSDDYNALFLGSSHIGHGVMPEVFDEEVKTLNGLDINSFNISTNRLMAPESYFIMENIADGRFPKLKYLFVEFSEIDFIDKEYLHTTRSKYWYSLDWLLFTIKGLYNYDIKDTTRSHALNHHLISYFEGIFHIGTFSDFNKYLDLELSPDTIKIPYEGFFATDAKAENERKRKRLNEQESRKLDIIRDNSNNQDFEKVYSKYNSENVRIAYKLIERLQKKGITVYYILPPRLLTKNYKLVLPDFSQLPKANKIELADAEKFVKLYAEEYSQDCNHLNKAGAEVFSRLLARQFTRLDEEKQQNQEDKKGEKRKKKRVRKF